MEILERLRRCIAALLAASLVVGLVALPRPVFAQEDKEYLIKAAFVYNFVKFVEWPATKAINQRSNIDICVLGNSPFLDTGSVFKAASTAKLSLSLLAEANARNITSHCHIVFISQSEEKRLSEVLAILKGQPVLTVSDIDDFVSNGGMIGFVMSDNKIRVEVNTRPVYAAGMRVDAQLLEIALRVIDK